MARALPSTDSEVNPSLKQPNESIVSTEHSLLEETSHLMSQEE